MSERTVECEFCCQRYPESYMAILALPDEIADVCRDTDCATFFVEERNPSWRRDPEVVAAVREVKRGSDDVV